MLRIRMNLDIVTVFVASAGIILLLVFFVLLFISAPYGRHVRTGWGAGINPRYGWLMMEAPASLVMLVAWWLLPTGLVVMGLMMLWQIHYFHRAFIYPFSLRSARLMPFSVVLMALVFNFANAGLNAWHFRLHHDWYTPQWLTTPAFQLGLLCFLVGYFVTKRADSILKGLRSEGQASREGEYFVPEGFLYRFVSCPNYLGESLQWLGWALMTSSPSFILPRSAVIVRPGRSTFLRITRCL